MEGAARSLGTVEDRVLHLFDVDALLAQQVEDHGHAFPVRDLERVVDLQALEEGGGGAEARGGGRQLEGDVGEIFPSAVLAAFDGS